MASNNKPDEVEIENYIKENLREVLSELEHDQMPDQITDLLSVLRAQDEQMKAKK